MVFGRIYIGLSFWKAPGRVGLSGRGIIGGISSMNCGGNVGLKNGGRIMSFRFYG